MKLKFIKDDRSLLTYLILGFLTGGIYSLWYIHRLAKDVNEMCGDYGKRTSGVVAYIFLSIITLGGYSVFWWYRVADMISYTAKKRDVDISLSPSVVMLSFVLGYFLLGMASWVGIYNVFQGANVLAEDYNRRHRTKSYLDEQRSLNAEEI